MTSPGYKYNQKTLKYLRETLGVIHVDGVEQYNSFTRKKKDLFNIIDYLGMSPGLLVGVQSTSYNGKSARKKKIMKENEEITKVWLSSGAHLWLFSWKKVGHRYVPDGLLFELDREGAVISKPLSTDHLCALVLRAHALVAAAPGMPVHSLPPL